MVLWGPPKEQPGVPEGVVCAQAEGGVLAILGSAGAACLVCGLGAARVVATAAWGGQSCPKWVVGYTIERSSFASVILPELPLLASLNLPGLPTCFPS